MRRTAWPVIAGAMVVAVWLGAGDAPAVQEPAVPAPLPPRLQAQIDALTPRSQQLLWRLSGHAFTWIAGAAADHAPGDPGRVSNVFGFDRFAVRDGYDHDRVAREFFALLRGPHRNRLLRLVGGDEAAQATLGTARAALATALRPSLRQEPVDAEAVLALSERIGRLEGERTLAQAKEFAAIARTLTTGQKQAMKELRDRALDLSREPGTTPAQWGQKLFLHCTPCHTRDAGRSHFGPPLFGVAGRRAGSVAGYTYGDALKAKGAAGLVWTDTNLDRYLSAPGEFVPGVRMSFEGLTGKDQRAAVIAYLRSLR